MKKFSKFIATLTAVATAFCAVPVLPEELNIIGSAETVISRDNDNDPVVSIAITAPLKTTYYVREELDLTGGEIKVTYKSGTTNC